MYAALAAGEAPGANLPPGAEDKRTRGQRRFGAGGGRAASSSAGAGAGPETERRTA